MRILIVCAFMPGCVAKALNLDRGVKEGWVDAALMGLLAGSEADLDISVAFAAPPGSPAIRGELSPLTCYSFPEDFSRLEELPPALMQSTASILQAARPDLIHIFGTEYPHGAAFAEAFGEPSRSLVSLQGLMGECAKHYRAGLPDKVWNAATFRDLLRSDSLKQQQEKFEKRAIFENRILQSAGHVAGRTAFDKAAALAVNPGLFYHHLGESLRSGFYQGAWSYEGCRKHSIFLSQGNYPLKGAHRLLECLPELTKEFPDLQVRIAGDNVAAAESLKGKLKLSAYGRYLRDLSRGFPVTFTGRLSAEEMREEMLSANVFLSPSSIENSSNSLGEAMLLGVPCAASRVGGIPDLAEDGKEALLYSFENSDEMISAIRRLFCDRDLCEALGSAASQKARRLFDPSGNASRLLQIYRELA